VEEGDDDTGDAEDGGVSSDPVRLLLPGQLRLGKTARSRGWIPAFFTSSPPLTSLVARTKSKLQVG
jgi:hypothetical protein